MEILKVQSNKSTGQKFINIPKTSIIDGGDYVEVDVIRSKSNIEFYREEFRQIALSNDDVSINWLCTKLTNCRSKIINVNTLMLLSPILEEDSDEDKIEIRKEFIKCLDNFVDNGLLNKESDEIYSFITELNILKERKKIDNYIDNVDYKGIIKEIIMHKLQTGSDYYILQDKLYKELLTMLSKYCDIYEDTMPDNKSYFGFKLKSKLISSALNILDE